MKIPKKPAGKINGKSVGTAKKALTQTGASKPAKKFDDDDDDFDEPLDDVDFDGLEKFDDDDDY